MGESFSKFSHYISPSRMINVINRKRKRMGDDEDNDEEDNRVIDGVMRTPKRKRLLCTSQYIFQTFFVDGVASDVDVVMLDKTWHLHKVYISQCPYFASMFSGSWMEAVERSIHIDVVDPNITLDSLNVILGSLYIDEITVAPANVISTLATAAMFQIEGIIEQCKEIMVETINVKTVLAYYGAACEYSLTTLKDATLKWLLVNLMSHVYERPDTLKEISMDLMKLLIASPDLFVIQIEFSLYTLLRYWAYLQVRQLSDGSSLDAAAQFYAQRSDEEAFLASEEGHPFAPVFRRLRFNQLVNHHSDIDTITADNIIPLAWFTPCIVQQWTQMLQADSGLDKGPRGTSAEDFAASCLRCGRTLKQEGESVWRWTGFNFGMDLVWTLTSAQSGGGTRKLKVRRNHRQDNPIEVLLSQQPKRNAMIRVTIASLNDQRQVSYCVTTGVKNFEFFKNQEVMLMSVDNEVTYPLHISVNLLVTTPMAPPISSSPVAIVNVPATSVALLAAPDCSTSTDT